jgi:hypothetical protein
MKIKALFLTSCLLASAGIAHADNLFDKYEGTTVKVFVADIKDSTQDHAMDAQTLKTELQKALTERRSIRFLIVPTAAEAQLTIDTNISEFMWSNNDPIDMLVGVGAVAADAAMVEDYARLQAEVIITDQRTSKIVWKDRVLASVTKKPMSQAESLPLVAEKYAKTFIKNCFSKKSR